MVSDCPDVRWFREHCWGILHFTMQLHLRCGGMSWQAGNVLTIAVPHMKCHHCVVQQAKYLLLCSHRRLTRAVTPQLKNYMMMVLEGTEERPHTTVTSRDAWSFSKQAQPTSLVTSPSQAAHLLNHILQHFHVQAIKCDNRNNVLRNTLGLHSTSVEDRNSAPTVELTGPNSSEERSAFTSVLMSPIRCN